MYLNYLADGLSIPAFWFGRTLRSRTLSLTSTVSRTLTFRSEGEHLPEWLLGTRRAQPTEATRPIPTQNVDLERGCHPSPPDSPTQNTTSAMHNNIKPIIHIEEDPGTYEMRKYPGTKPDRGSRPACQTSPPPAKEIRTSISSRSMEHGVRAVTDGKEEVVGHGSASLRPADDSSDSDGEKIVSSKDSKTSDEGGDSVLEIIVADVEAQQVNASKTGPIAQ